MSADSSSLLDHFAIIGDIHAEDILLSVTLEYLKKQGDFPILCTGDIVTGKGDANRCCHLLEENQVLTVRGNHDRWFFSEGYTEKLPYATLIESIDPQARNYLETLPILLSFKTRYGPLLLAHGTETNDMLGVYPGDGEWVLEANPKLHKLYAENHYRILIGGHTHQRMVRSFDHLVLLNPGTLKREPKSGFLIVNLEREEVTSFDIGYGNTIQEANTILLPRKVIQ